ncbi:MAG: periplasmic heavy metal sensor, partial [Desulfobacca sp.]|uniref:periplasmic heavy metal sensor n=1 Tax=Desulfobacca sp. TaxID=2067990 RepID=UPI004049D434
LYITRRNILPLILQEESYMTTGSGKNFVLLITILTLSLGLAGFSWARPYGLGDCCGLGGFGLGLGPGKRGGYGLAMMQLTPEQAGKAFDLHQKFMTETADLRRQLLVRQAELAELWRAKEPDQAKIAAKQKEVNALMDQLQEKALPYKVAMRQICPMMGQGMGPGPMGRQPAAPVKK